MWFPMSGENMQCSGDRPCAAVQLLTQAQVSTDRRLELVESDVKAIRDRLPPWTLAVASLGSIIIGLLGGLVLH